MQACMSCQRAQEWWAHPCMAPLQMLRSGSRTSSHFTVLCVPARGAWLFAATAAACLVLWYNGDRSFSAVAGARACAPVSVDGRRRRLRTRMPDAELLTGYVFLSIPLKCDRRLPTYRRAAERCTVWAARQCYTVLSLCVGSTVQWLLCKAFMFWWCNEERHHFI